MIDAEQRPGGEQFAKGNETRQPVSDLVSHSFDAETIEAQLYEMVEEQREMAVSKSEYFNPSRFIYRYLQRRSAWLFKLEVPEGVEVEEAEAQGHKMALALGILAYPQWRPEDQISFR